MQMICSYVLWPLAVVMGVNVADCRKVAEMIGTKTFLNEFVAYSQLSQLIHNRETLERHVTDNGTWYWHDDDVILTSPGFNDTVLTNGVITVLLRCLLYMTLLSCVADAATPSWSSLPLCSFYSTCVWSEIIPSNHSEKNRKTCALCVPSNVKLIDYI